MNAIELLKEDHREVKALFTDFRRGSGTEEAKRMTAQKVFTVLEVHTQIEEEFFYPAVQDLSDKKSLELTHEAREEHRIAKLLISELQGLPFGGVDYDAKFNVLIESVEHHIAEEEATLFPWAEKNLGEDTLAVIGRRLSQRKQALMKPSIVSETLHRAKDLVSGALASAAESLGVKPAARPRSKRVTKPGALVTPKKRVTKITAATKKTKRTTAKTTPRSHSTHTRAARKR